MDTSQFKFYLNMRFFNRRTLVAAPNRDTAELMGCDFTTGYIAQGSTTQQVAKGSTLEIDKRQVIVSLETAQMYNPDEAYTNHRAWDFKIAESFIAEYAIDSRIHLTVVWSKGKHGALLYYKANGEPWNLTDVYGDREHVEYTLYAYCRAARLAGVILEIDWTTPSKAEQKIMHEWGHQMEWYQKSIMNRHREWLESHEFKPWDKETK